MYSRPNKIGQRLAILYSGAFCVVYCTMWFEKAYSQQMLTLSAYKTLTGSRTLAL